MAGHFLNGRTCNSCGHSWWEFDRCCGAPAILINPSEVARYGNEGPWTKPPKLEVALELIESGLKKLKEAQ